MEVQLKKENILGTAGISTLLVKFAVPGIISMVVNSIYNIVDQVFIGRGVGYLGNGATNVIYPMTTLALAFSLMVGNGAGSYMSLMLGRKEEEQASRGAAAGMIGTVGVGVILAVLYLIFLTPLCRLFGATDAILPYAIQYGTIISIGIPFSCIDAGYAALIRSDGSPKFNMAGLLLGCALNIILDPIFIFILHMGVQGAALATIIGQIANAILCFIYIPHFKTIEVSRRIFGSCMGTMGKVVNLGLSSFISQFVVVIAMTVQNNLMVIYGAKSAYGADIPMTAMGVTMKVFSILLAIIMGLATGAQPIFGYNYGARKYDRVKQTFRYVMIISIAVNTVAFILFQLCPGAIVSIFGTDSELYTEFSIKCLKIFLLLLPLSALQMVSGIFFQSLGRPTQSSLISLSKQIIFLLPFSFALPVFLGVEGVLWAGPVSDLLSFILCLVLYKMYWKQMFAEADAAPGSRAADGASLANDSSARSGEAGEGFLGDGQIAGPAAPNVIITIGRAYGAGGRTIGRALAEQLDIPFYDGEILQQASEECGLNRRYMEHVDEKMRNYRLVYSLVPLRNPSIFGMDELRRISDDAQNEIIERAAQGPCVIVGRRADQILRRRPNVVRVFLNGNEEYRASRAAAQEGISLDEALRKLRDIDKNRSNYYGELSGREWGHSANYDVCIDTGTIGTDGAVHIVLEAVRRRLREEEEGTI